MAKKKNTRPFELMDCALITMATGKRALNLRELRDRIAEIEDSSLYYHFYENLLQPSFDDPEFRNDFAAWAKRALHDTRLAEKLGMLNPLACCSMDELRRMLVDQIEDQLAEREFVPWAHREDEFHFLTSRVVVFDTGRRFGGWEDLGRAVREMSTGSIFFHFIEARRRPPIELDDFSAWIAQWGEATAAVREGLQRVDYYFWTLTELRERVARVFDECGAQGEAS
jgi:hypothetical protein